MRYPIQRILEKYQGQRQNVLYRVESKGSFTKTFGKRSSLIKHLHFQINCYKFVMNLNNKLTIAMTIRENYIVEFLEI